MKHTIIIFLIFCTTAILYGCGARIDPAVIETALIDAQSSITTARSVQAEELANQQLAKAERLLADAQKAQKEVNLQESLDLAFQANIEAKIAASEAQRIIIERRIEQVKADTVRADLSRMAHRIVVSEARQAIAEHKTQLAQADAEAARLEAAIARAEAARQIEIAKVKLAIAKAELAVRAATEAEAATYAANFLNAAQKRVSDAQSLLSEEKFDDAINAAADAEQRASQARSAAIASAEAIRTEMEADKRQEFTDAKVAIAKAELALKNADNVNASIHAENLYQRARQALNQANIVLKSEEYKQAMNLAAQSEVHAINAYSIAEVKERETRAQEEQEELIAEAKDALFKAKEAFVQASATDAPQLAAKTYLQARTTLDDADKTYNAENYEQAIKLANQSASHIADAIAQAQVIKEAESAILANAQAIGKTKVQQTQKGVLISFSGDIFKSGSVDVNPNYSSQLKKLANILKKHAEYKVVIEGHTDSSGGSKRNLELSEKRAANVLQHLVEKEGVHKNQLTSTGYGDKQPIFPNPKDQRNRRIDIVILTRWSLW